MLGHYYYYSIITNKHNHVVTVLDSWHKGSNNSNVTNPAVDNKE